MYDIEAIVTDIREVRLNKNYSQEYLANKLRISQNTYSEIESGNIKIPLQMLFAIAKVLDIRIVRT
jgi:transcriptional regulator with XRE-family HTH domain